MREEFWQQLSGMKTFLSTKCIHETGFISLNILSNKEIPDDTRNIYSFITLTHKKGLYLSWIKHDDWEHPPFSIFVVVAKMDDSTT